MTETAPAPSDLRETIARTLYEHDSINFAAALKWEGDALDAEHPDLRGRYLDRADALIAGPLAQLVSSTSEQAQMYAEQEEELRVLRRQRIAPERERELLKANNRMLERARTAEAAKDDAQVALAAVQRERDVAREAEAFWQQFAFDADDLATQRLVKEAADRAAAERTAILERTQRQRVEAALRLFADRADVMPKEGWVSDLAGANRDIPLWWFHAARVALERADPAVPEEPEA